MERLLAPDEEIRYSTAVHRKVYLTPLVLLAAWGVVRYLGVSILDGSDRLIAGLWLGFALALFIQAYYKRNATTFYVTTRRVLIKSGLIGLSTKGLRLPQIETIDVNQSLQGRIFNYGNITIYGTGTSVIRIKDIEKPFKFRKALVTAIKDFKD